MHISITQAQQRKQASSVTPVLYHKTMGVHKQSKTPTVNTTLEAIYQEFTKKQTQNPKREETRGDKLMRIYD